MTDKISTKKQTKTEKKPIASNKFKSLVEQIEQMTVLELIELTEILQKKFGVSTIAQPVVASAEGSEQDQNKEIKEEKAFFNIELHSIGDKKIEVIKAVRDITAKGLKESKDLVDSVAEGFQLVKEKVKKEEAEEIKKKLETVGAKVKLV